MSNTAGANQTPRAAGLLRVAFIVEDKKYGEGEFLVNTGVAGIRANPASRFDAAVSSWRWNKSVAGSVLNARDDLPLIQEYDPKVPCLHWRLEFNAQRENDAMEFPVTLNIAFDDPTDCMHIEADCTRYRFRNGFVQSPNARGAITSVTVTLQS